MYFLSLLFPQCADPIGLRGCVIAQAIYEEAKLSPLNQSPKMVGWEALSKVMDLDFLKAGIGQRVSNDSKL